MEITTAKYLIEHLVYKPKWRFEVEDHTNRFEGCVAVTFHYPAFNSNRDQAECQYPEEIMTYAKFPIQVVDCDGDLQLYRRMLTQILDIEEHEAREFLRVQGTWWSPFHPHKEGGMKNWAKTNTPDCTSVRRDLQFGIA